MKIKIFTIIAFFLLISSFELKAQLQDNKIILDILGRLASKETESKLKDDLNDLKERSRNQPSTLEVTKNPDGTFRLFKVYVNPPAPNTPFDKTLDPKYYGSPYLSDYHTYLLQNLPNYPAGDIEQYHNLKNLLVTLIPQPTIKMESGYVDDPMIIIDLFEVFRAKNRITILDKPVDQVYLKYLMNRIIDKKDVVIYVQRPDEGKKIDRVSFYSKAEMMDKDLPDSLRFPLFDECVSEVAVLDVVGTSNSLSSEKKWETLVKKPENKDFESVALRLSLFDPEFRLFNSRWGATASLFMKWGNYDNVPILGWYADEMALGVKYADQSEMLSVAGGIVSNTTRPYKNLAPDVPFYNSGLGLYFNINGTFLPLIWALSVSGVDEEQAKKDFIVSLEFRTNINNNRKTSTFKDLKADTDFYTLRNILNYELRYKIRGVTIEPFKGLIFGSPEIALGAVHFDDRLYRFELGQKEVYDPKGDKMMDFSKNMISLKLAFVKATGFVKHKIEVFYNSNKLMLVNPDYAFLGASLEIMFNNWIGFQAKIASRVGSETSLPWTKDIYGIFSPIIMLDF